MSLEKLQKPDRYVLFGNPVTHSKSPQIHTAFAKQAGHNLVYDKVCVSVGEFQNAADKFFAEGGKGMNITFPFKQEAFEYADEITERARMAGAVNLLMCREDGRIQADNTDGYGLVLDLEERLGWDLEGREILILGAGGAVRGAVYPLLQQRPKGIVVANRTVAKVHELAEKFAAHGPVVGREIYINEEKPFDLIINGTAASLSGDVPALNPGCIDKKTRVYDMFYSKEPTSFMRWAAEHGAEHISDGLGMLLGQAAESYFIWRGVHIDIKPVFDALSKI